MELRDGAWAGDTHVGPITERGVSEASGVEELTGSGHGEWTRRVRGRGSQDRAPGADKGPARD